MPEPDRSRSGVPWEVVEFGSMAVLLSTLALVVGGLASGIATSVNLPNASTAVEFGAQWAGPLLGMILLGLVGLSWWQHEGWMNADYDDGNDGVAALGGAGLLIGRKLRVG